MKRAELFHPRIFDDSAWAAEYQRRNAKNIAWTGRRLAKRLGALGFQGGRILDVGCGFGAVGVELAKAFPAATVRGVDLADPLLEMARTLATESGVADRVVFATGDAMKLDADTGSFDVVVNTYLLHLVENPTAMLNEIARVARPGGTVLIMDLRRCWLGWFVKKLRTALTADEAAALIAGSALPAAAVTTGPFFWEYAAAI